MIKVLVCFAIFQISARPTRPRPEGGGGSNQGSYGFCLFPLSKAAPKNIRLLHPPPRLNIDHIGFKKRCLKFDFLPSSKHRLDSNPCHPMRSPTKSQPSLVNLYLIDQTETTKGQKAKFIATYNCLFKILLRRHCGHFFYFLSNVSKRNLVIETPSIFARKMFDFGLHEKLLIRLLGALHKQTDLRLVTSTKKTLLSAVVTRNDFS